MARPAKEAKPQPVVIEGFIFTTNEARFLRLLCEDIEYKEIGKRMFKSENTIQGYAVRIRHKLNIKTRIGLILWALLHKNQIPNL